MQGVFNPNILINHPPNSAEGLHFSAFRCYSHCGCPTCVCVCVSVRSFLPPRASRPRNVGTYVFTATRKLFIAIAIIIVIFFAENASFRSYDWRHLLASNATNCS